MFKKRENVVEIEEGNLLSPKFDNEGLIVVMFVIDLVSIDLYLLDQLKMVEKLR